jgi:mevalonate kinase
MHRQWNAAMDALETHYANALKALMDQAKHLDASLEAAGISHADRVMDVARRLDLSAARRAA